MTATSRKELGGLIAKRLAAFTRGAKEQFENTAPIRYFVIDGLLPKDLAVAIFNVFPGEAELRLKKSLRELKYVSAQMNRHKSLLEDITYAFQETEVVDLIKQVVSKEDIYPDMHLYAGGISMMGKGHYLNPHIDNSHDKDRNRWRNFNLLYYVTPDWPEDGGGNLELWPEGPSGKQITIHSKFNRLVVMETHQRAWHSVSPITGSTARRCCVSNYYFGDTPMRGDQQFHVTSFRGRPEQPLIDLALRTDIWLRMKIRKVFKHGVVENKHRYIRDEYR